MQVDGNPLPPPAPRGTPAIRLDLLRSVRLHPVLAASVAALTFAVVAGYAVTRKPVYKAEALDYVEPANAKVLSDGSEGAFDSTRYESYLQQQIQTLQRPDILQAAAESLPVGPWRYPGESVPNAATRLGNSLKVERQGTSFQLSLSLMGPDADSTAQAVNAVNAAYLQKGRKDETARTDGRVQLLSEEKDRLGTELQADRAEQVTLGSTLGVANPVGPTADAYDTDLSSIRAELVSARQAHDIAAAQLASVTGPDGASSSGMAAIATQDTASDPGLQALKTSFSQRRAALTSQMAGLTAANPLYRQDQAELAQLDQQLAFRASLAQNTSAQQLRDRLRLELKRTGDVEARLNGQLARATALATTAAPRLQRASELAADIERLQARYAAVDNALRGLQLEANAPGVVHLSVPATPPTSPEPSRRKLLLLASVPLALLFGALAAVIARRRSGRVYTEGDLEPILGFTPIGSMPYVHGLSSGGGSESLLRLAAGLERAHRRGAVQTFVFTPVSPSTDIASMVAALGRELERLGFRVRLRSTGELLRSWDRPSSESEILVAGIRQGISARLDALKQKADFVLLEAPPLLHSAEAEYFLSAADTTVLVIESGVTTERELNPAMDLLRKLHVGGLAAVLLSGDGEADSYSLASATARAPRISPELQPDPPPDRTPEPPRSGRWSGLFNRSEETSSSLSFIPSTYEEGEYATAKTSTEVGAPLIAEAIGRSAITSPAVPATPIQAAKPIHQAEAVHPQRLKPLVFTEQYDTAAAVSSSEAVPIQAHEAVPVLVDEAVSPARKQPGAPGPDSRTRVSAAPSAASDSLLSTEVSAPVAPAGPAPSMLLWQAHIRHRAPAVEGAPPATHAASAEAVAVDRPRTDFTQFSEQSQSQGTVDPRGMTWTPFDGFRPFDSFNKSAKAEPLAAAPDAIVHFSELQGSLAPEEPSVAAPAEPTIAVAQEIAPEHAVAAEPIGEFAPQQGVVPTLDAQSDVAPVAATQPPVASLTNPTPATVVEPRRLPSSAERLAFRAQASTPRRPSLPSVRVAPPVPRQQPRYVEAPLAAAAPAAPRLVPSARPTQPVARYMSPGDVAERIVSTSSTRVPIASNAATRPHIMPSREEAGAGRRFAMLNRFSKPTAAAEAGADLRDLSPRDRAAG